MPSSSHHMWRVSWQTIYSCFHSFSSIYWVPTKCWLCAILGVDKLGAILLSSCSWPWAECCFKVLRGDQVKSRRNLCCPQRSGENSQECGDEAQQCWPNAREWPRVLICLSHWVFTSTSFCRWGHWGPEKGKVMTSFTELESAKATLIENRVWLQGLVAFMNWLHISRKSMGLGAEETWIQIPALPFPSCVTVGKLLIWRLFSHLQIRHNRVLTLQGSCEGDFNA